MNLRMDAVGKRYPSPGGGRVALDGVSLELGRGQMIGIYGPSGAGKTTLLRIAAGLLAPDSGSVSYDGVCLHEMSAGERLRLRRREIACVWAAQPWQDRLGVLAHVALPLLVDRRDHRSAERAAREALLACEAEQCIEMACEELSEGQRQRVAIARALVSQPRLLIADGPTARLAAIEREAIMALLGTLAHQAGTAVLVADSDAEALLGADQILYLRDGRLLEPEVTSRGGQVYHLQGSGRRRAGGSR